MRVPAFFGVGNRRESNPARIPCLSVVNQFGSNWLLQLLERNNTPARSLGFSLQKLWPFDHNFGLRIAQKWRSNALANGTIFNIHHLPVMRWTMSLEARYRLCRR
jgi:hypothetical protein